MTKIKAFFICFAIPFVGILLLGASSLGSRNGEDLSLAPILVLLLFLVSLSFPALIIGEKFGKEFRQNGLYGTLMSILLMASIYVLHFSYHVI